MQQRGVVCESVVLRIVLLCPRGLPVATGTAVGIPRLWPLSRGHGARIVALGDSDGGLTEACHSFEKKYYVLCYASYAGGLLLSLLMLSCL